MKLSAWGKAKVLALLNDWNREEESAELLLQRILWTITVDQAHPVEENAPRVS